MNSIVFIIISLLFSAFFSGMEIAFVSSNKLKIELDKDKGFISGKILSFFANNPSKLIVTLLIGNNIALVIYSALMTNQLPFSGLVNPLAVILVQTVISTIIILFISEFLPKTLFRLNPNRTLLLFAVFLKLIYYLFYPFTKIFLWLSNAILKIFIKDSISFHKQAFTTIDLDDYVSSFSSGVEENEEIKELEQQEIAIFQNAIEFRKVKLRECMIPRTEIMALDVNDNIDVLTEKFIATGHSKILIYEDSIDNIIGYASVHDMFFEPKSISSVLRDLIIVPETMAAKQLLNQFILEKKNIAIVVDEFGGTSGLLTLEDVIEEITGEINDEFDTENLTEKQNGENDFVFSARLEIDYLNEKYNFNIPESEEYETLAGYILSVNKDIPELGEELEIENLIIKISEADNHKIKTVNLTKVKK